MDLSSLKIFTCNSTMELAYEIVDYIGVEIGKATIKHFSDGEISLIVDESVRGCDVYIVQSMCNSVNDNLLELLIMIDALHRASAQRITVVVPYYGYVHQDCNSCGREPITAKLVANLITRAGADAILTIDLHTTQIQGFFDIPVDNLSAVPVFSEYFRHKDVDNLVVASLDMGGMARVRMLAEQIGVPFAIVNKLCPIQNTSEGINVIGDIKGKEVILVDNMIDNVGTIVQSVRGLMARGAKCVDVCCTHGVVSNSAIEYISSLPIREMVITNTVPLDDKQCEKMKVLSVAPIFGDAILRMHTSRE